MFFYVDVLKKQSRKDYQGNYWLAVEGDYQGKVVWVEQASNNKKNWQMVVLKLSREAEFCPISKPFFMIAGNGYLIFVDNGDLKGDYLYAVEDIVTINIRSDKQNLKCLSDNNEFKFEKGGIRLAYISFPSDKFEKLNEKFDVGCDMIIPQKVY